MKINRIKLLAKLPHGGAGRASDAQSGLARKYWGSYVDCLIGLGGEVLANPLSPWPRPGREMGLIRKLDKAWSAET